MVAGGPHAASEDQSVISLCLMAGCGRLDWRRSVCILLLFASCRGDFCSGNAVLGSVGPIRGALAHQKGGDDALRQLRGREIGEVPLSLSVAHDNPGDDNKEVWMPPEIPPATLMDARRTGSHTLQDIEVSWNSSYGTIPAKPRSGKVSAPSVRDGKWFESVARYVRPRHRPSSYARYGRKQSTNVHGLDRMHVHNMDSSGARLHWCIQAGQRTRPAVEECRSHEPVKTGTGMRASLVRMPEWKLRKVRNDMAAGGGGDQDAVCKQYLLCSLKAKHLKNKRWNTMFRELMEFKRKFGHTRPASQGSQLSFWVARQRCRFNAGEMPRCRIQKLREIGFCWDSREKKWDERYKDLAFFRQKHGHCQVPKKYHPLPKLGNWLSLQRDSLRCGRMDQDRLALLQEIGFVWDVFQHDWEHYLEELEKYIKRSGNTVVPAVPNSDLDEGLCQWASMQRFRFRKGILSPTREKRMRDVGFCFNCQDDRWQARLDRVQKAIMRGGTNWWRNIEEGKTLRQWFQSQELLAMRGKLSPSRAVLFQESIHRFKFSNLTGRSTKERNTRRISQRRGNSSIIFHSLVFSGLAHVRRAVIENEILVSRSSFVVLGE